MLLISFLFVILTKQFLSATQLENHDICQSYSSKIYFHSEDYGTIAAKNIINDSTNNSIQECYVELITCPSCIIVVHFTFLNVSYRRDSECNCEYVEIREHPYEKISSKKICAPDLVGSIFKYQSQTRYLIIKLVYIYDNSISFIANYTSINNKIVLPDKPYFFTSPYFPAYYVEDLIIEYEIQCPKIIYDNCQIQLIITDFQISPMSIMEFSREEDGVDIIAGLGFWPTILVFDGPSLFIRFIAHGGTGIGFRIQYSFISNQTEQEEYNDYNTECGGLVDDLGGAITMMNMVESGTKKFFCFWKIKPSINYPSFKTYLYLKIINFTNMEDTTELIVYKTTTSYGKILQVASNNKTSISTEHIQPIDIGFYISFKGVFGVKSRLAIVYAAFSYKECFSASNFLCANHRCIPRHLTCDGFDHCGDNSDENIECYAVSNSEAIERSWYSRTPNYFFPNIDRYSDLRTTGLILLLISFGLICVLLAFILLLYKIMNRNGHQRDLQNHLQIITDMLEEEILDTESISDEPPIYEAPPDYDEVFKIEFDAASKKSKKKKKRNRSIKSRKSEITEISPTTNLPPNYNDSCQSTNSLPSTSAITDAEKIKNKSLSSKRKWHSYGDINHKNVKSNKKQINLFKPLGKLEITKRLYYRKTASDSDLLNLESVNSNE